MFVKLFCNPHRIRFLMFIGFKEIQIIELAKMTVTLVSLDRLCNSVKNLHPRYCQ